MGKTRIAIAGAGLVGMQHIEAFRNAPTAVLASIVDVSPKAAEAARAAGVSLFGTFAELFERDRPDGIIVATPNQMHLEHGLACVAAGVPTLMEKPIAPTRQAGIELCEAAERAGVQLLVGHHRRHSPILQQAVEIVQSGALGPIVAIMGSAVFYKPDSDGYYDGPHAWRRQAGGGPILINMIHEVGNLRSLVGEIVAVQAFSSNSTRHFEVEDTVAINLRFANGALGTFLLSDTAACAKSWEQTSQENKAFTSCPDEDAYTIIGAMGSLSVPTMRLAFYERAEDRSWNKPFSRTTIPLRREPPLVNQIEHFAAVIRGEAEPLVTGRDGVQNLRVTEAIAEAARTGRIIMTMDESADHGAPHL